MKSRLLAAMIFLGMATILILEAFRKPPVAGERGSNKTVIFCAPSFDIDQLKAGKAPLIKGLGKLHYAVTTRSKTAQQYFNQGLTLIYAFNHGEAARSFQQAIILDSSCAMAYWGMVMVLGPNYNAALNPSSLQDIHANMEKAVKYSRKATVKEQTLINALSSRFPKEAVKDMTPFNEAYSTAMKQAHEQYPEDAEIGALYADALMNEHPWNLWLKDGTPQPWTVAIVQLLEQTISLAPEHPGALHLYTHAVEASRMAHKGLVAADRLLTLLPAAGHLVHMPAHIYLRTGHYHKGVLATEKSRISDSNYINQCKSQGTYPLLYYPHNIHFLAACAFLEGNSQKAIEAAWGVSRNADRKYLAELGTVQHYYIIPYYVLVHVGKWDDILAIPMPGESLKYPRAIWHYARGMAFTAKGNLEAAKAELALLQQYAADESMRPFLVWETNSALYLNTIASLTLESEILTAQQKYEPAIALLKKAVAIEDQLNYQEPPDWFFSVRHSLGHVLVQSKQYAAAQKIYEEDLVALPENGWALMGLYNSLTGQQKTAEAAAVKQRFEKAWQWADMTISSSRKY
jgi:tetratricopeptide (TPR) repeat protein